MTSSDPGSRRLAIRTRRSSPQRAEHAPEVNTTAQGHSEARDWTYCYLDCSETDWHLVIKLALPWILDILQTQMKVALTRFKSCDFVASFSHVSPTYEFIQGNIMLSSYLSGFKTVMFNCRHPDNNVVTHARLIRGFGGLHWSYYCMYGQLFRQLLSIVLRIHSGANGHWEEVKLAMNLGIRASVFRQFHSKKRTG
jgi:hypothetical protein